MLITLEFLGGPADGHKEEGVDLDFINAHETIKTEGPDVSSIYKRMSIEPHRAVYAFDTQLLSFLDKPPPNTQHRAGPD